VIDGATVREVLDAATERYGAAFAEVLPACRVWVNGDAADAGTVVADVDEVAVLPPVSGGL
jgi:molybdopterin converting factor small subunit